MTWRPIETAPMDGRRVLLYREHDRRQTVGWWGGNVYAGWIIGGRSPEFMTAPNPTHWMPLPEPPKTPVGATEAGDD